MLRGFVYFLFFKLITEYKAGLTAKWMLLHTRHMRNAKLWMMASDDYTTMSKEQRFVA